MKLKRVFQLAEELSTWGFDSSCGDISEKEEAEYRVAMDNLWELVRGFLLIIKNQQAENKASGIACDPLFDDDDLEEATEWLKIKGKWV